jgi:hypothetical protein
MLELGIAIAISSLLVTSILLGMTTVYDFTAYLEHYVDALKLTITNLESETASSTNIFNSTLTTIFSTPCLRKIIATTEWHERNQVKNINLEKFLSSSNVFDAFGHDCGGFMDTRPYTIFETHTSSFSGINAFDVVGNAMFRATVGTSSALIKENDSEMVTMNSPPISDLDAIETTVFGAANTPDHQVLIFDAQTLSLIASTSLPDVSGSFPVGRSIAYYDHLLFVGTHRTAGREFHVFDVSDPSAPVWRTSIELNHNINDIAIQNNFAYLATSGNTHDVIIIDFSEMNLVRVANIDIPGNEDANTIAVLDHYLYVGKAKGQTKDHPEFSIFDIANPASPLLLGNLYLGETILSLVVSGNTAYVSTDAAKLYVIDISDKSNPKIITALSTPMPILKLDYDQEKIIGTAADGTITILH